MASSLALRRLFPNFKFLAADISLSRPNPIAVATRSGFAASRRYFSNPGGVDGDEDWYVRETDEGYYVRMEMEGLDKEDVKVSVNVEENTLSIKGEGGFCSFHHLPELCKTDGVKAEMKNGVLKVVVPKVREQDRAELIHVKVE
ncbi:unnamed protein product [Malus baccata var. baccata]